MRELVKLHAIHKKQPMKEFVGKKRETAEEKSKKHHPMAARGLGDALGTRKNDRSIKSNYSLLLGLSQIGFFELRCNPLGGHGTVFVLWLPFPVCNFLLGNSEKVCSGAARKLQNVREIQQWWQRKNKELVKSKKKPHSPPYKAS
jgi:hypothetical protein